MASKALPVLGFLLLAALLVSSEAAVREVAEKSQEEKKTKEAGVADQKQGEYPGGGYPSGGYPGGGYPGGGPATSYEPLPVPVPAGGVCYYGCCGLGNYGGCRCCATADEKPDAEYLPEPRH